MTDGRRIGTQGCLFRLPLDWIPLWNPGTGERVSGQQVGFAGPTGRGAASQAQPFKGIGKPFTALSDRGIAASSAGPAPSGSRRTARRRATLFVGLASVVALALSLGASTASAKVQWEPKYTFGPDGTPGTQFSAATAVGVQQGEGRVYVQDTNYPSGKVYGFEREEPGKLTPLGSPFPVTSHWVGYGALPVDNTANPSKGNFYLALGDYEEVPSVEGWSPAGAALSEFKPAVGNKCGGAVDNDGHLWIANENNGSLEVFDPTGGESIETRAFSNPEGSFGRICGIAFNPSTGDLFASWRYGTGVWRYTASSNYETATKVPGTGTGSCCEGSPPIAVDGNSNRLYVFREGEFHCCPVFYNTTVQVFNLTTLQEVESFSPPSRPVRSFAVDEASDTLFFPIRPELAGEGEFSKVQEWRKVNAPIVTTGPAVANEKVSGSVALDGAGNVTACWAEFGIENKPEGFTKSSTSCSGSLPYEADQANVTVDLTGQVEGEKTYYYRLAATNGDGVGQGEIKSFLPTGSPRSRRCPRRTKLGRGRV